MHQLDAQGVSDLLALYQDAAAQVRGAIRSRVDSTDTVPQQNLQALLRQIEDIVAQLGQQRDALLQANIEQAAALGTRPLTAQGIGAVGGGSSVAPGAAPAAQAVLTSTNAFAINQAAVQFVTTFRAADGLTLADRLWRLDMGAKEALQRAIGSAVVQGWGAAKAARDFAMAGGVLPQDIAGQLASSKASNLVDLADLLTSNNGGEVWKAERVLRTEINRAHGEAFMAGGEQTPGFAGWRFLLSPAHPRPDICDLLATQNLYGLGPGVYPDRATMGSVWPAHPNTLSFVEIVFADELTPEDAAGKETPLQALQRLSSDVRDGVLGQTKASYFDQGLLTRGSIRSPLRAVRARLQRHGAAV